MRTGLIASIALHVAVIGALFANFSGSKTADEPQPPPPVAVEVMTPAEFSERLAGQNKGKAEAPASPAEKKAAEAPQAAPKEAEPKPAPKPTQAALPPPQRRSDTPPVKRAEAPKPEAKPKPEAAPKKAAEAPKPAPEPDPKPAEAEPRARDFDADRIAALLREKAAEPASPPPGPDLQAAPSKTYEERIAALLNRDPNAGETGGAPSREPWRPASSLEDQARGLPQASGLRNAASCGDVVRARIERNWDLPIGGISADATVVRLRIELNRDGSLTRPPLVLDRAPTPGFQAVADAAVRAAVRGQPYPIPPDQFERCRIMNLTFDPREMYGG